MKPFIEIPLEKDFVVTIFTAHIVSILHSKNDMNNKCTITFINGGNTTVNHSYEFIMGLIQG